MKEIVFVRHAKADYPDLCRDFDRPLTKKGRKDAEKLGAAFFNNGINPDLVICSSAQRTKETYELIRPFFQNSPTLVYTDELYFSDVAAYKTFIAEAEDQYQRLMFVGHNPSVSLMTAILDEHSAGHEMGTAHAVHIIFETRQWIEVRSGRINLILLPE